MAAAPRDDKHVLVDVNTCISQFTKASANLVQSVQKDPNNCTAPLMAFLASVNALVRVLPPKMVEPIQTAAAEVKEAVSSGGDSARIFTATAAVAARVKSVVCKFVAEVQENARSSGEIDKPVIDINKYEQDDRESTSSQGSSRAVMEQVVNSHLQAFAQKAGLFIDYINSLPAEDLDPLSLLAHTKAVLEVVAALHETLTNENDKERLHSSAQGLVAIVRAMSRAGSSADGEGLRPSLSALVSTVKECTTSYLSGIKEAEVVDIKQPLGFSTFDTMAMVRKVTPNAPLGSPTAANPRPKPALPPRPFRPRSLATLTQPELAVPAASAGYDSDEEINGGGQGASSESSKSAAKVSSQLRTLNQALGGIQAAVFEGWLTKQGGSIKTWKRRYFVLNNLHLVYYKEKEDVEANNPLGSILVPSYELATAPETKKAFAFKLSHPVGRSYYFAAASESDFSAWMQVLGEKGLVPQSDRPETSGSASVKQDESGSVVLHNGQVILVLDSLNRIVAGTLETLVMRLAYENEPDDEYIATFIFGFRHFMDAGYLLDCLLARYNIEAPAGASTAEVEYAREWAPIVQERVLRFLQKWVKAMYYVDFDGDRELKDKLVTFLDELVEAKAHPALVADVKKTLQVLSYRTNSLLVQDFFNGSTSPATSIVPDLDPELVAQQLCLLDMQLFHSIRAEEFAVNLWGDADEHSQSIIVNLLAFIERFNKISFWVATEICLCADLNNRARILRQFILIATACLKYNNFNSMVAIVIGLNTSPVQRLKKTWALLSARTVTQMHKLEVFMDPALNYKVYRDEVKLREMPCIPFFGLYIKDLTFMNDGNPKRLENGLLNFDKIRTIHKLVLDIGSFSGSVYNFAADTPIQTYLRDVYVIDEKVLYEYSLLCEPRAKAGGTEVRLIEKWLTEG